MKAFGSRRYLLGMVGAISTILLSACYSAAGSGPARTPQPGSAAEVEAIYRARIDSARLRFTTADVEFMTGMLHHHAQAVEIAGMAASRSASSSVRTLAARIISAQQDEIAIIEQWLRDRGQPVPTLHPTGHHTGVHMPGMVTPEQVQQLVGASGAEFDRLFLRLMIQHHRGAVQMVHELFATDGAAQDEEVFKFASDVQVDQSTEVARMELMLRAIPH